ncbi:hypothetical protein BDW74DRAFT_165181 [Aspergillus multicolor]|uniref:uncharacterized protein n=1 Tax=Aspergillus multicolor TaxID=41759 RepID=UPI003CCC9077
MTLSALPLVLAVAAASLLYQYIIYPAFLSPLFKIPTGHWFAHISPLWILSVRRRRQENQTVFELHEKYGKAVRLAPNTVSLNCYEGGLKQVYLGGFPKNISMSTDSPTLGMTGPGALDNAAHSARKRILSHTFSKTFVASSPTARETIREILFRHTLPIIDDHASQGKPLEMLTLLYSYSMVSFIHWQFGRSAGSNLIRKDEEKWAEFPLFARRMMRLGVQLLPMNILRGRRKIDGWNLERCDKAQKVITAPAKHQPMDAERSDDYPAVYAQAYKSLTSSDNQTQKAAEKRSYSTEIDIAADMLMLEGAALETTGATLSYVLLELSRNPIVQEKLREELQTLSPNLKYPGKETEIELPSPKDVDALPPIPGRQERMVPRTCSLGGYSDIPTGTTVYCSAYSLHRKADVFPELLVWRPERWLDASPKQLSEMRRWFWAFGSGAQMCIGSNFALYSMKYVAGAIYSTYRTRIHDHGDMEQKDGYIAGPKGNRLELIFERY